MKWFHDLKIGTKLMASFLAVLVLTAFMGVFSILQLEAVNGAGEEVRGNWLPTMRAAQGARYWAANYRLKEARHVMASVMATKNATENELTEATEALNVRVTEYEGLTTLAEERQYIESFKSAWRDYMNTSATVLELSRQGPSNELEALYSGESRSRFEAAVAILEQISQLSDRNTAASGARANDLAHDARFAIIAVLIAALILGLVLAFVIARIISRPLNVAAQVAAQLAEGDLTATIEVTSKDETGLLLLAMQNMIGKLSAIITEVRSSADNLASASEEVSATAQSMSQASSEQAASVEETSASIEQMSASINQNTENAKVTDGMASKAAKEANEGGDAVQQTVNAMKQIAQRISIIDDIAYQTNLLALNAAIEAARAGEHGKGFAVVAAEVRKLAERSQVAAQEIGELSSDSVQLAEKAGKLLDEIVPSIRKTSDLVQEISAASEEQASGVSQINTAMVQLNQITQQNASSSEELAATSEEMSSQAEQLQHAMSFFTVDSNGSGKQNFSTKKAADKKAAAPARRSQKPFAHAAVAGVVENEFTRF